MTCVQTRPCLNPPQDTMAGFSPEKLPRTRTKATARYIVFIYLFFAALFCKTRIHVVRSYVSLSTASRDSIDRSGLPQSPWQDPRAQVEVIHVCQSRYLPHLIR